MDAFPRRRRVAVISPRGRRLIACGAVVVAGGWAALRLDLRYAPPRGAPEIEVDVSAGDAAGPAAVARTWFLPIEAAIRSLPGLAGTAGEVASGGGWLRARFAPGIDAEPRARLLAADLRGLAHQLAGQGSFDIQVTGGSSSETAAIVALRGAASGAAAPRLVAALESCPTIRRVELLGGWRDVTVVRLRPAAAALLPRVEAALRTWQGVRPLGVFQAEGRAREPGRPGDPAGAEGRGWPVTAEASRGPLAGIVIAGPAGPVRLGAVAEIAGAREPMPRQVHVEGRAARALVVTAADQASPFEFEADLRRNLALLPAGVTAETLRDDVAELRRLLLCLGLGALSAAVILGAAGWRAGGAAGAVDACLALPVAVAAALLACRIGGVVIDLSMATVIAGAVAAALPSGLLRGPRQADGRRSLPVAVTCGLGAAGVPVALALGGTALAQLLVRPAWAFCFSLLAALGAMTLLPAPRRGRRPAWPRLLPRALRQADGVVLGGVTAIVVALVLWRGELLAVAPQDAADGPDLAVEVALPQGASLGEAESQVGAVEQALATLEGVRRFWSQLDTRHARIEVQVAPAWRGRGSLQLLVERLRLNLPAAADATLRIGLGADQGRAVPSTPNLEDLAAADDLGNEYRCILRSTSLELLQQGYSRFAATLLARQVKRERLHPDWGPLTLQEELAPRRGALPREVREIAAALRSRTLPAARLAFPAQPERALVVLAHDADLDPDQAPQRAELLDQALPAPTAGGSGGGPVQAAALLTAARWTDAGRISRQSGRFVLPVGVDFPSAAEGVRKGQREALDHALAAAPLPAGVELDRPPLSAFTHAVTKLAEAAPAGFLLLLWLGIATVRLGSPGAALAAALPLGAGLAAAAAGLWLAASVGPAQLGPLALLLLAAGLTAGLPIAIHMAETAETAAAGARGVPGRRAGAARRYAWQEPWACWGGLAAAALLVIPALASGGSRVPWALPLWLAALAAAATLAAAVYLVPSLIEAGAGWRRRSSAARRALARPAAWEAPGSPSLTVRNLTKTYRGGVTALAAVSFELRPGIIGLLGPNGAGKTTLLRLLVGILAPSRGSVFFRGLRVTAQNGEAYRSQLGFLPQNLNAYPGFTARHYLDHWADARGLPRGAARDREIGGLLARVGLLEHENRKARDFSGGMLRRLGIAAALLGSPPLLIVDEPTAGLDFAARADFRQLLLEAVASNDANDANDAAAGNRRIVLLSTHIASDVEAVANRLFVLDRGRLHYDGSVAGLIAAARGRVFAALVEDAEIAAAGARYRLTSRIRTLDGVQIRAIAAPGQELPGPAVEPTLEEAYLALLTPAAQRDV
jgi:ABC-2 type transport system ATP-binding protein